jgi:hypothetical protein
MTVAVAEDLCCGRPVSVYEPYNDTPSCQFMIAGSAIALQREEEHSSTYSSSFPHKMFLKSSDRSSPELPQLLPRSPLRQSFCSKVEMREHIRS